jgi:hypothetical protein
MNGSLRVQNLSQKASLEFREGNDPSSLNKITF